MKLQIETLSKKLLAQRIAEPGSSVGPLLPGFVNRDAERGGDLVVTQAAEMTQFNNLGDHRVFRRQPSERFVDREEAFVGSWGGHVSDFNAVILAAVLASGLSPGVLDEDPSHRLGRGGEEMAAAVEVLVTDQPQISLVDQGGGVERVPGSLGGHFRGGELAQLVVDEREQFRGGPAVTIIGGFDQMSQLRHEGSVYNTVNRRRRHDGRLVGRCVGDRFDGENGALLERPQVRPAYRRIFQIGYRDWPTMIQCERRITWGRCAPIWR
jgi:hypothetical protein